MLELIHARFKIFLDHALISDPTLVYVPLWSYKYCGIMIILWIDSFITIDALFEYLPYQLLTVGSRPTVVLTGNGELGFDSGEGA